MLIGTTWEENAKVRPYIDFFLMGRLSQRSLLGTDCLWGHQFIRVKGYGLTHLLYATRTKHIRARKYECRFLGSSHHASNTAACSYLAITWNCRIHGMQAISESLCHEVCPNYLELANNQLTRVRITVLLVLRLYIEVLPHIILKR